MASVSRLYPKSLLVCCSSHRKIGCRWCDSVCEPRTYTIPYSHLLFHTRKEIRTGKRKENPSLSLLSSNVPFFYASVECTVFIFTGEKSRGCFHAKGSTCKGLSAAKNMEDEFLSLVRLVTQDGDGVQREGGQPLLSSVILHMLRSRFCGADLKQRQRKGVTGEPSQVVVPVPLFAVTIAAFCGMNLQAIVGLDFCLSAPLSPKSLFFPKSTS